MQFVRDNLFYVTLIAVVVVLGGLIVAAGFSFSGGADRQMQAKQSVADALAACRRAKPVNQRHIAIEKDRVSSIQAAAKEVAQACRKWNNRNYSVFRTSTLVDGKPFPAFPDDPRNSRILEQCHWEFAADYQRVMDEVLKLLRPTSPPTAEKIGERAKIWEGRLLRQLEAERLKKAWEGAERPAGEAGPEGRLGPAGTPPLRIQTGRDAGVSGQAEEEATRELREAKAAQGSCYASFEAMDMVYPRRAGVATLYDRRKLWRAAVNSWVTRDIFSAIAETIRKALAKSGKPFDEAGVPDSPIKRLLEIGIQELPYTGGQPNYGETIGGGGRAGETGTGSLTGRLSTADYDVIRYRFTVLMSTRYIQELQEKLAAQNYHTVLSIQADKPGASVDGVSGMPAGHAKASVRGRGLYYYYGVEPIMQVTIAGELLLRTDWCRDLMPVEVLSDAPLTPALRPEDTERLQRSALVR